MGIHVNLGRLIASEHFCDAFRDRISDLSTKPHSKYPAERQYEKADLVLVPAVETQLPSFQKLKDSIQNVVAIPEGVWSAFPEERWALDLQENVRAAHNITVLSVGSVTGGSLQAGLVGVQKTRTDRNYVLRGLVGHSRPDRADTWSGLQNSFAFRLEAVFDTVLPDSSPFEEEAGYLEELPVDGSFSLEASSFVESRRQAIRDGFTDGVIFWGGRSGDELSSHSIFGDRLSAVATFASVAASIERRRNEPIPPPERLVFNMGRIFLSYYDALILASMIRCLRPPEFLWLPDASAAESQIQAALERSGHEGRRILLPEFLFAAASGRLPRCTHTVLRALAKRSLADEGGDPGALALGLRLLDWLPGKG